MIMFDILKVKNIFQIERALINHLIVAKQFFFILSNEGLGLMSFMEDVLVF